MWDENKIDDEVKICKDRIIEDIFFKYLNKEDTYLEAGCGLGAWVIYLKQKGYKILGIDHDEKVINRVKDFKKDIEVESGDICNLKYEDNSLDGYISLGVIEHFEEGTKKPVDEAYRVVKHGGRYIITVPCDNLFRKVFAHPLREVYLIIKKLTGQEIHFGEYRYTIDEFKNLFDSDRFKILYEGIDDFKSKNMAMTLWSEFPFLQDKNNLYRLNGLGKLIAYTLNSISRNILAAGVLLVLEKK